MFQASACIKSQAITYEHMRVALQSACRLPLKAVTYNIETRNHNVNQVLKYNELGDNEIRRLVETTGDLMVAFKVDV